VQGSGPSPAVSKQPRWAGSSLQPTTGSSRSPRTSFRSLRLGWSLAPLSYGLGMLWVMAVRIEPQATAEARLEGELHFGSALDVGDEPAVSFIHLPQYIRQRQAPFQFRHLSIEGIDAAVLGRVPRWSASLDDERQVFQGFLLPPGHMCDDVFHRPTTRDTGFRQLRL
jgi:hypothetical protein